MTLKSVKYICPCCGFKTLYDFFSYDICKVCNWENDPSQLEYPALNDGSLCEEPAIILKSIPVTVKGFPRDKE